MLRALFNKNIKPRKYTMQILKQKFCEEETITKQNDIYRSVKRYLHKICKLTTNIPKNAEIYVKFILYFYYFQQFQNKKPSHFLFGVYN